MTDNLGKRKEIGIKCRQDLLKIIRSLPAAMQKELNPIRVQIGENLKKISEKNQTETLESNQVIESYSEQINQYIKDAKTEGLLSRRSFLQISSFFTATGLLQFLFVRKAKAGVTIPFAFFKQGIPAQTYVDDVFSAYTYTGNGGTQTITNGIALGNSYTTDQIAFTIPGTYSWTVPTGVTSVCVVCVGGGGGPDITTPNGCAGGGGGLSYGNDIV